MRIKFHYAWMIIFVTFLTFLAVQGVRLSFGAFMEPWEKEFSLDRGTFACLSIIILAAAAVLNLLLPEPNQPN